LLYCWRHHFLCCNWFWTWCHFFLWNFCSFLFFWCFGCTPCFGNNFLYIFTFLTDNRQQSVYRCSGSFFDTNMQQHTIVKRFKFHSSLICLNFGKNLSR